MKTFLKVVLLLIGVVIALKLLPMVIGIGGFLAAALVGILLAVGSILAAMLGVAVMMIAVLSPLWIPVLAIVGLVALVKALSGPSRGVSP